MNQIDQNINKDMIDSDLIDVESLDFSDNQTWLCIIPDDSGNKVDIVDWNLSCDWPVNEDIEYQKLEKDLFTTLDSIIKNEIYAMPDKHKFDSRTYVRPKRRPQRPSIQSIVEVSSNPPSISPSSSLNSSNKYLTYNKYSMPLGPVNPMLRLKTFNVDVNTDNSNSVKEYAMKRRSLVQDEDPQLEDLEMPSPDGDRLAEHTPTKPINIDLSQPAHNLHNTFNKGLTNMMNERGSLNMYQSGESLMRMSPPSLVSSLLMESSGTFYPESLESKKCPPHRDAGPPTIGRESIDPMMTSMTLSILDEKDMSTSFLSQTTYPDNDSLMDSLPPSLVSSVNSSYVVSNTSKPENIFSSATFTHLEQTERLLSSRPRAALYNSFKRESMPRNSESYTKSKEQAVQIDGAKILNENCDKKDSSKSTPKTPEMTETITLHYSNNKFRKDNDAEKENLNATFQQDDAFFKDMGMQKVDLGRNSLNVTLDKQELNEIIQARQKLSLARKALPTEPDKVDTSPIKTIQLPNQTITVPRQSMENASELLSRRRMNGGFDRHEEPTRETPKRNATFKKVSPSKAMDTTVVFVKDEQMIDINSATLNLIDSSERTLQQEEWGSQERAMVGSSESTDTGTFSSSSPPESTVDTEPETRSYTTMAPPSNVPRKTNLPTSKLRQYSSHRELSRIPGGNPSGLVRPSSGKAMIRRNVYASNPALSPTASVAPPIRRDSYTVTTDAQKNDDKPTPVVTAPPALVRQGTETLRRERPQSQLVAPRELRVPHTTPAGGVSIRSHQMPPPTSRPYSVAGTSHLRVATHSRLGSVPIHKPAPATQPTQPTQPAVPRPQSSERASALPRPSRLPARRPSLRPPSVYSVAPTADVDHY
ncbi:proteoglycan 4-like isoform X6 [Plodia interpunctella]|uniref:proteoglycan 4-like isoform X6 n=1 Tax=Plodia interpunctella TaxID=58824 RepID=UPI0023674A27|nr:proteoglycan 4-like isoform X6 [Plodia interpunctella]